MFNRTHQATTPRRDAAKTLAVMDSAAQALACLAAALVVGLICQPAAVPTKAAALATGLAARPVACTSVVSPDAVLKPDARRRWSA